MKKSDCIFCQIIEGKIPSYRIYEDCDNIAILDIFPNTRGMTLVIPKEHYDSYAFEMQDDAYTKFFLTAKKIGKELDKKLAVQRTALVAEGMGINHVHIKLYPLHGLGPEFKPMIPNGEHYFKKYRGYITTLLGPRANDGEMKKLQELLKF